MKIFDILKKKIQEKRFEHYSQVDKMNFEYRYSFYGDIIRKIFTENGLDPYFGLAIAMQESSFRSTKFVITGGDAKVGGSYGLMMVSSKTSKSLGYDGDPIDLCIPSTGVLWSAKAVLNIKNDMNLKSIRDIASVYNSGRPYSLAPDSTKNVYVINILKYMFDFQEKDKAKKTKSNITKIN